MHLTDGDGMVNTVDPDQTALEEQSDQGLQCLHRPVCSNTSKQFFDNFFAFQYFSFYASHPESKKPMHRELGFIRMKPGTNQVALMIAQNAGTSLSWLSLITHNLKIVEPKTFTGISIFNQL